jgi:ornithine carbamoyltransferase
MWQRFTERARRAVFFAQEEALRLGQAYVGTEHLLLGLIREVDNVASRVIDKLGASPVRVRTEIEARADRGDGKLGLDMQLTPRAKRAIDLAYDEARQLSNNFIATEHLLLGLIREADGLAGRVLARLGVELEAVRREVRRLQADTEAAVRLDERQRVPSLPRNARYPGLQQIAGLLRVDLREENGWRGRSLVTLADLSREQIESVLLVASYFKGFHAGATSTNIQHSDRAHLKWSYPRTLGMIFEKPSLRTRVSFEAGMAHLGGHAIYLAPGDIGLGTREPVADVAAALSRWVDVISARVFKHETVEELAEHATVPVINALSDREHPIQAFADLLTLTEQKGPLGNNLKLAYIGDGNNVLHALLLACSIMGVNLSAACPDGYMPDPEYVRLATEAAAATGATVSVGTDPAEAAENADALYTDVWTSMGQETERDSRLAAFAPYRIDAALTAKAKPDAIVLHCLPAHCGEEISAEVFEKHRTVIMDQAENRMHTQKALIALMIGI